MTKYNKIQIEELSNNPYVLKCGKTWITFSKECKLEAVKLWNNWISTKRIFKDFWFPEYVVDDIIPKNSVCRWNKQYLLHWEDAFWKLSKRWKKLGFKWKKKLNINKLTNDELIEYYKTENAYLKELIKEKHWFYP